MAKIMLQGIAAVMLITGFLGILFIPGAAADAWVKTISIIGCICMLLIAMFFAWVSIADLEDEE